MKQVLREELFPQSRAAQARLVESCRPLGNSVDNFQFCIAGSYQQFHYCCVPFLSCRLGDARKGKKSFILRWRVPVSHSGNRVSHRCDCGHQDDEEYHEKSPGNRNQSQCLRRPRTHPTHKGTHKGKPKGTYKGNHEATRPVGATLGSTLAGTLSATLLGTVAGTLSATVADTCASTIVFSLPPLSSHAVTHFSPHVIIKSGLLNPEHFCLLVLPCVKVALHFQASANATAGLWARLPQEATVSANPTRRREQRLQPPAAPRGLARPRGECSARRRGHHRSRRGRGGSRAGSGRPRTPEVLAAGRAGPRVGRRRREAGGGWAEGTRGGD
ncbi:hypothetical protein J1605_014023 [Eschrichtius robustus]|uniref:Uncharacterized protein n=1 Tax=Eschrichtius robustus TaxID=9764 RepID=A0AB34GDD1_ESCRO|nr:hypothetical protein J1605_014023 [Eschrichtius robustus]